MVTRHAGNGAKTEALCDPAMKSTARHLAVLVLIAAQVGVFLLVLKYLCRPARNEIVLASGLRGGRRGRGLVGGPWSPPLKMETWEIWVKFLVAFAP